MIITDIQVLMLIVFIAIVITLSDIWIAHSYRKDLEDLKKEIKKNGK